jgi:ribonuclease III
MGQPVAKSFAADSPDRRIECQGLVDGIGVDISDDLLELALTHRSFAYENGGLPTNERLEFLGDSVLGLVITETLFSTHPNVPEGHLAKLRAAVVNSRALADVARTLGLGDCIRLGRGEISTGGSDKSSILADTLEALLGAIYLQHGLAESARVIHRLFDPLMREAALLGAGLDWKTSLQELTAQRGIGVPEYHLKETGPDHEKSFTANVWVGERSFSTGSGRSKKEAEQQAAELAYRELSAETDPADG